MLEVVFAFTRMAGSAVVTVEGKKGFFNLICYIEVKMDVRTSVWSRFSLDPEIIPPCYDICDFFI